MANATEETANLILAALAPGIEVTPAASPQLPVALGTWSPAMSLSVTQAQSLTVCTWQVTAGTGVKPLVPVWVLSTAYLVGEPVTNDGGVYRCITAGTSASSGGPTGQTSDITDGTAHWCYVAPVASAFGSGFIVVNIDATSIVYYGTSAALTTIKASAPLFTSGGSVTLPASPAPIYIVAGASAIVGVTACI